MVFRPFEQASVHDSSRVLVDTSRVRIKMKGAGTTAGADEVKQLQNTVRSLTPPAGALGLKVDVKNVSGTAEIRITTSAPVDETKVLGELLLLLKVPNTLRTLKLDRTKIKFEVVGPVGAGALRAPGL